MSRIAEFFAAVKSGDTAQVEEILTAEPARATAKDDEGATALHYAAERGRREIVKLLLETGADINACDDEFGATPAGWALRSTTCSSRFVRRTFGGFAG